MKKTMMLVAACACLAACNNGKTAGNAAGQDSVAADSAIADSSVYVGVTPAADSFGIKYRLAVANDSTKGFSMRQAYLESETKESEVFYNSGKTEVVNQNGKTYYKLQMGQNSPSVNFLVLNDSTLRMVNSELQEAASGLNYDLKLEK